MSNKLQFDEFMEKDNRVTNYCKDGKCSECGECCTRNLALNTYEINTIKAYIKKHNIQQQKHVVNVYAEKMFDAVCPFLDDTKSNHKCTIYPVRPLICREFICKQDFVPSKELMLSNRRKCDMVITFFENN